MPSAQLIAASLLLVAVIAMILDEVLNITGVVSGFLSQYEPVKYVKDLISQKDQQIGDAMKVIGSWEGDYPVDGPTLPEVDAARITETLRQMGKSDAEINEYLKKVVVTGSHFLPSYFLKGTENPQFQDSLQAREEIRKEALVKNRIEQMNPSVGMDYDEADSKRIKEAINLAESEHFDVLAQLKHSSYGVAVPIVTRTSMFPKILQPRHDLPVLKAGIDDDRDIYNYTKTTGFFIPPV